jgi:hypothetical protein
MDLASGHVAALNKLKKEHLRLKVDKLVGMIGLRGTTAYKHISEDLYAFCLIINASLPFNKQDRIENTRGHCERRGQWEV